MSSQLYCYASTYFSAANNTKLIGLAFCFAGCFSLIGSPMRVHALKYGVHAMLSVLLSIGIFAAGLLTVLQFIDSKGFLTPRTSIIHLKHRHKQ